MLKQNLKVFFRSLFRRGGHSLLMLSSLILGLVVVLLAFVFIQDETGYDKFHSQGERIFRINKWVKENNGDLSKNSETPGRMAPTLDSDFPEVEAATHIAPWFDEVLISYDDQNTYVKNWVFADSNFFEVFDFEMIKGDDPVKILSTPGNIIVTPQIAKILFGKKDPIGKTIQGQNDKKFVIAGIANPAPRQSHIQYDVLVSWASTQGNADYMDFSFLNNWLGQTVYTYVLLRQPEQMLAVNKKFPDFTAQYMANRKDTYDFFLQPLDDIYLNSTGLLFLRGGKYGSLSFLRTFSIIALLILLIACFNYINITTAKSLQRAKEVGVKKVLGAGKGKLIQQFMNETVVMTTLAGIIAFAMAWLLLPTMNIWFEKDIPSEAFFTKATIGFLVAIILGTSLIAGFFPSWVLTKFKPVTVMSNSMKLAPGGQLPRQVLTTSQLTISIGLIAMTLLLYSQFNYILNKDLGFDTEQILVMKNPPGVIENAQAFKNELNSLPGIQSISMCNAVVEDGTFTTTVIPDEYNGRELPVQLFRVDTNYLNTFGMEISDGRFLGLATDVDPGAMVVNEAFVRQAGWENPLEKQIQFPGSGNKFPIVGILKDFNFKSLHQEVAPLVMYLDSRQSNTSVRLDPSQLSTLLPQIKKLWEKFESRHPFDYTFLDDYFSAKYTSEQQMLSIIKLFAFLAIFIACLGLYGLASFTIARRRKEIGIRKVLGASVWSIVAILSSRLVKLVVLALLIASPVVYYYGNDWLNDFAYRVDLGSWVFLLAGGIVLLIVFITVGLQSVQAALVNPVRSLRRD